MTARGRTGVGLLVGVPALLLVLWAAGQLAAAASPDLPSSPGSTLALLPLARLLRDVAAVVAVGAVVVGGVLVPGRSPRVLRWASCSAAVWGLAVVAQVVLTLSDILPASLSDAADPTVMWSFLTEVTVGRVLLAEAAAAALVALLAPAVIGRVTAWVVVVVALVGAGLPALLGHGGLSAQHAAATVSLALHVAAVSLWVGGLVVVVALLRREPGRTAVLLPAFSAMALVCVLVVAESGLVNASLRLGSAAVLLGSWYGALVLAKAVLLGWLVRLGWLQRQRVLTAIPSGPKVTTGLLARIAAWEFAVMGLALALSVALGRIGPLPVLPGAAPVAPLTVVTLVLALPMLLCWSRLDRTVPLWVQRIRRYPEIVAVVVLVVVAEVTAVVNPAAVMGGDVGVVLGAAALVGAGFVLAAATLSPGGTAGVVVTMLGWPVVSWLAATRSSGPLGGEAAVPAVAASVLVAELLLVAMLVHVRQARRATCPTVEPVREAVAAA